MKVLLTGASGYVGQHLLRSLLEKPYKIILLLRDDEKVKSLIADHPEKVRIVLLSDPMWKLQVEEEQPEVIVHLAAYLTSSDDNDVIDKLINANIVFGTHLLDALKGYKPEFFINTGSFAEYTGEERKLSPVYLYAATKTAFRSILEYYRKVIGFKVVNIIPYTIYGRGGGSKKMIDYIFDSLYASYPVNMSPGEQVLDFIHLNDVVSFYTKLIENYTKLDKDYCDFHLGTGKGTTPRQLALLIEKVFAGKTNINWGGKPYRVMDTMYAVALPGLLAQTIGWAPGINLEEGLFLEFNNKRIGT